MYDKRDDFNFEIEIFLTWMGMFLVDVYISQIIAFARVSSHVSDFNTK